MNGGVQTKRSGAMAACRGLLVVVGLAVGCGALAAQEDRPRVGLVLSGGGARGFAHLGVLEVLHEERIPIDVIAGTSMGAVVGGIYATGLPYPELERLFRQEDWATIFEDEPARRELPMWRKQFSRMQLMGFEVGIGSTGVKLPPSIVNGAKLSTALSTHVLRARDVESFDDLPIPFRAIATDVEDGSMVVLDSGSLAAAIRASMAVPGAFTPGVIDGRRLVDGGLVRNIPVDVARAMGVDVLIVSDVATSLDEAPDATDALSLASRLVTVVTWGPSRDQLATLESTDFYLRPELTTVSSADFTTFDEAFAAGLASAEGQRAQLRSLSISEVDYQALVQDRVDALAEVEEFVPAGIRVVATETSLRPEVVEDLMRVEVGRPLTLPELRRALTRAQGYGGFQGIDFGIVDEPGGEVLELHPRDKPWGPVVARAGLSLVDRQRGRGAWSLRGVVDWSRLSSKGGEAIAEIELGTRHGLAVLGYLPLTVSGRFFARGSAQMGREEVFPEFVGLALGLDLARRDAFAGLGVRLGWWGEVVAGMRIGHSELILPEETPEVEEELTWAERSVEVVLDADILDRVVFPSRGAALRVSYVKAGTALGGSDAFEHAYAEARSAVSWGHQTLELSGLLSSGFGSTLPFYRSVPLGGFDRLTGVDRDAIRGSYAGLGKLVWSYRLGAPAAASGGGVRLGFSVEGGQGWYDPIALDDALRDLLWGGSIWAGMNTPIGVLRIAYADLGGRSPGWVVQLGAGR